MFDLWRQARNRHNPEDPVPEDLLTSFNPALLNMHFSKFDVEARSSNGDVYPPATIQQLLCGSLRHIKETTPGCPNFLNSQFRHLQGTLDSLFTIFILMALVYKYDTQSLSQSQMKKNFGLVVSWVSALRNCSKTQLSSLWGKCLL